MIQDLVSGETRHIEIQKNEIRLDLTQHSETFEPACSLLDDIGSLLQKAQEYVPVYRLVVDDQDAKLRISGLEPLFSFWRFDTGAGKSLKVRDQGVASDRL